MGDAVLTHGLQADPSILRDFLALAGAPDEPDDQPPPEKLAYSIRRAHADLRCAGERAAG